MKIFCIIFFLAFTINLNATDFYQTTGNLNLRSGPSSQFNLIGTIKNGEKVTLIEKTNSRWFKIEYNGKIGFLSSKFLTPVATEIPKVLETPQVDPETTGSSITTFLILGAIVAIILIIFNLSSKKKTTILKNKSPNNQREIEKKTEKDIVKSTSKNLAVEVKPSTLININIDDSIIDVTGKSYSISTTNNLVKYGSGVPNWPHHYVYSHSEINYATYEQKIFYGIFKRSFLDGKYIDLEGNSNYSFILLFDLLNEYETHKSIPKLEKQLETLGQCYPKTKSYGNSFLIQKMEEKGDSVGVSRLRIDEKFSYQSSNHSNEYERVGDQYKTKLNLQENEINLLNKLWYPSNTFCSIEFCFLEILKLYIATIKELEVKYIQEGTTLDAVFFSVADIIAKKQFKYKTGSNNYKYCIDSSINEFYSYILKHCENAVRMHYGHKRKVNSNTAYLDVVNTEFEAQIISKVLAIIPTIISRINLPDEATEIELYSQNTNRWKIKFKELTDNYNDNPKRFFENILALGNLNKNNPSLENIFLDASKFISKHNKEKGLRLYIYYLYYDLKSATFDNKQLTKTIQKNLFKTNEQLHDFEILVSELIRDSNLEKALLSVSKIYAIKRKKIKLDSAAIKEVQQQHSGTVELLNEYLKDEYEDENSTIKTQEINTEEVKIEITHKADETQQSIYAGDIAFTQIHKSVLDMFAKSNFSITQNELELFAKSKGVFTNQLIESMNEVCFENLDDILIEEEDEFYTINPNYYQTLLTK
jgi:hypothetical protein